MTDTVTIRFLNRSTPPHIATLIIMAGLSALSMNTFLPSLPIMATHFDTEYRVMQLSVALYLAVSAVMQLLIGPISDQLGRRPVVLGGIAIFILASIGCVYAPNITVFLVFRMIQAVVTVGIVLSRAVVRDVFSEDQSASMIGYVTAGMAVAPMISPAIGGVLEAAFGWTGSFWFLAILGVIVLWLCWSDMGETAKTRGTPFREQVRQYPELLASPRFWGYAIACAASSGAFFSYLGGAPFVGSEIFDMSPTMLGLHFGAPAVGYMLGNIFTGRFAHRFGINPMVFAGCIVCAFGIILSLMLFYTDNGSPLTFFGCMTFIGFGNGMSIPNATAGMLSVRPLLAGTASGLGGALMIGGGAGLSAIAGALLSHETGAYPLLYLMLASTMVGVLAMIVVIRRERKLNQ